MLHTLEKTKQVFDKYKIEFWLDWGTLLGAIRNGRLIDGDHDIDLCVWQKDLPKIKQACRELPFYYYFEKDKFLRIYNGEYMIGILLVYFENGRFPFEFTIPNHKLGKLLDSMVWFLNNRDPKYKETEMPRPVVNLLSKTVSKLPFKTKILNITEVLKSKLDSTHYLLSIPEIFFKKFKLISFYGMRVKIPKKAEDYLTYKYGHDWRTPNKNYCYWKDDHSIIKTW